MGDRPTSDMSSPFGLLGLSRDATPEQIAQARRRLAKSLHPDRGGDGQAMRRLNAAFEAAMEIATATPTPHDEPTSRLTADGPHGRLTADGPHGRLTADGPHGRLTADHPSFTIEALPVEAHVALLEALDGIASVVVDDPPYLIEVEWLGSIVPAASPDVSSSTIGWGRLDLVPDAGSTTVSLTLASAALGIELIRDLLIARLNALDWTELTS